jgi:steroid delta-isomerase-like uncharacterized protein
MTRRWIPAAALIVSLVVVTSCVCEPCDEGKKNKELVAEAFAAVAAGEMDKLEQYIADDYVRHCQATPDVVVTSLAEFKDYLAKEREAVPNPEVVIHRLVAEDDLVSFWATYGGIQEGPMGPFPATGKRMEIDFAGMHRIADGKIAETWVTWDNLAGLTQLGLFPPGPGEPAPE